MKKVKACLMFALCLWMLSISISRAESTPARWQTENNTQKNVHIIIDAEIDQPTMAEVPVLEVRRTIVSEDQLLRIAECCMPGQKLFAVDRYRKLLSPQPERVTMYIDESDDWTTSSAVKPVFHRSLFGDGTRFIHARYQILPGGQPLKVSAELQILRGSLTAQYTHGLFNYDDDAPNQIGSLSLLEAQTRADECAKAIDQSMTLKAVQTVPLVTYTDTSGVEYKHQITGLGYVFSFTRNVNGLPITYESTQDGQSLDSINDNYTIPFAYEKLQFVIGQEGIIGFTYRSPYEVLPEPIDAVSLLPIGEIQSIISRMLPLKYAAAARSEMITLRAHRLVFGYTRVTMRNDPGRYMLVPAWDLMGTQQWGDDGALNDAYGSLLTINAADGTVIDRGFGY
jgi:hypothetical protein